MPRPHGRGWKEKKKHVYRSDWLTKGGQVVRKGFVVTLHVMRDDVVLRAWSLYNRYDVRQMLVPLWAWLGVSPEQREGWVEMALSKPGKDAGGTARQAQPSVALFDRCPTVRAYLLDRYFDDGSPRQTATLTVFLNPQGLLGGILKDREGNRALFGQGANLDEVAESLEDQLLSGDPSWRADKQDTGSSKRIR